jgi:uncharacterized protein YggU (UPF0235/DUF167 family)
VDRLPDAPHPPWLRTGSNFVTIEIVARPGSQRRGLLKLEARGLVIGVASPAEKGHANEELVATIAEMAQVPRGMVTILRGNTTRSKVFRIATSAPSDLARRLEVLTSEAKQK